MRRRYVFAGRVQGVGFRATAVHVAHGFSVTGWVRNDPERTVTLETQGEPREIDRFIAELSLRMAKNIQSTSFLEVPAVNNEDAFVVTK